jgi:UDP-N-acetyl-D-mannosaminuronic acid dehydrogenase
VIDRVRRKAAKFKEPVIGCLGLAFKADVDDVRESPALQIVRRLRDENIGRILVCEPNLKSSGEFDLLGVNDVIAKSDILVVLVDHREFKRLKTPTLKEKVVIDTRGIL